MSETFCPIPWIFQAIRNNGDIRLCCQANVTKNQGVIRKQDGSPFNASKDSINEARNATLMNTVRKQMLEGVWSNECERCNKEEQAGLNSRRIYELSNWDYSITNAIADTNIDGSIKDIPLEYLDIRFGNTCNLACRMCGPTDSHTWYEQWTKYHNTNEYTDTHGIVNLTRNQNGRLTTIDYDWHNSETFWEQLHQYIPTLKHVYMAGGEPLLIERHYDFLQECINLQCAKNIILEYNTNMTSLPKKVLLLWGNFKQVRIGASIDGYGKMCEYQRWPINWNQAFNNLKKLDEYANNNSNIVAWLACTVTIYNVWHIPEFMHWKLKHSNFTKINSSNTRPIITPHIAHKPNRTNIKILPMELKNQLNDHYEYWKSVFLSDTSLSENIKSNAIGILNSIIKYTNNNNGSENDIKEFISFTNFLDKERNQSILDLVPQYKYIFDQYV